MRECIVLLGVLVMAGSASGTMTIVGPVWPNGGETFEIGLDVAGEDALITDVLAIAGNVASIDVTGVVLNDTQVAPYFEDLSADPDFQAFMADLKPVHQAMNNEAAESALDELEKFGVLTTRS